MHPIHCERIILLLTKRDILEVIQWSNDCVYLGGVDNTFFELPYPRTHQIDNTVRPKGNNMSRNSEYKNCEAVFRLEVSICILHKILQDYLTNNFQKSGSGVVLLFSE